MIAESDDAFDTLALSAVHRYCRVETRSGSIYHVIEQTRSNFWVRVENVPNPQSEAIPRDRWWQIEPALPWPPQVGLPLMLIAPRALAKGHADRMPGGGKVTSPVIGLGEVTWLPGSDGPSAA